MSRGADPDGILIDLPENGECSEVLASLSQPDDQLSAYLSRLAEPMSVGNSFYRKKSWRW
jgi:hypothetical protein